MIHNFFFKERGRVFEYRKPSPSNETLVVIELGLILADDFLSEYLTIWSVPRILPPSKLELSDNTFSSQISCSVGFQFVAFMLLNCLRDSCLVPARFWLPVVSGWGRLCVVCGGGGVMVAPPQQAPSSDKNFIFGDSPEWILLRSTNYRSGKRK